MTIGGREQLEPRPDGGVIHRGLFADSQRLSSSVQEVKYKLADEEEEEGTAIPRRGVQQYGPSRNSNKLKRGDTNETESQEELEDEDQEELLSEALLAVASAEEYAAKIIKLQQACLTPLKEDLADWLNKIMNMSTITTDNFMDKLDNGVIICRLAKIISLWCEQQLAASSASPNSNNNDDDDQLQQITPPPNQQPTSDTANSHLKLDAPPPLSNHHLLRAPSNSSKLSSSILNVHQTINNTGSTPNNDTYKPYQNCNERNFTSVLATPLRQSQPRLKMFPTSSGVPSRSSSQSTNCLISSSTTSLNNGYTSQGNQFIGNLLRMEQTKIWEDAKCRTFYARDNVCNFIRWSKEFGVNQSVLFESDDLVLHANTRQVVLCLLDVARIACVKHGFTEAPGLVKFEQEIDRELAAEKAAAIEQLTHNSKDGYNELHSSGNRQPQTNETSANRKLSSLAKNSRVGSLTDATDDLIMRYCLHKEEEAAKKKAAAELEAKLKAGEEEAKAAAEATIQAADSSSKSEAEEANAATSPIVVNQVKDDWQIDTPDTTTEVEGTTIESQATEVTPFEVDSLTSVHKSEHTDSADQLSELPFPTESMMQKNNLNYDNRVDSLDSGEGRTESASTSHSRTPVIGAKAQKASSIPIPIKRSNSNTSLISNQTSSMGTSELSSSRSSLFSGQDSSSAKRGVASDLDGKVMRIAKSYYGKSATKGVTRLSEGKYKIADRIVFVRLLKGHLVMVRIGGGWDTLENFLFRHKSDPSQVIDVDNLLPLETKMTFEKSPQLTPTTSNKFSKLPYYRRSSSASSTNLSTSNLSVSNHSPTSSSTNSTTNSTAINNRTNHRDRPPARTIRLKSAVNQSLINLSPLVAATVTRAID